MTDTLCEETSWECSDKYSLYGEAVCLAIEDDRLVTRIGRVWYEEHTLVSCLELLQCGLIVDERNHYLSVRRHIRLFDEDEITILDSLLIHGVTIGTEEKILLAFRDNLGGYWDLGFDIFLCEYRHPTCDGTDEGDIAYSYTICLE